MASIKRYYLCDKCDGGQVAVLVKQVRDIFDIKVGNCNKCKHSHGLKSVSGLKEVPAQPDYNNPKPEDVKEMPWQNNRLM